MDLCLSKCCELIQGLWLQTRGHTSVSDMLTSPSKKRRNLFFNYQWKFHYYHIIILTFTEWVRWLGASNVANTWVVLTTVSWYRNSVRWLRKYFYWLAVVTISISYSHVNYRKAEEFKIMWEMRGANTIKIPVSEELKVFQRITGWNPRGGFLQGERTQETCLIFLDTLIRAQKGTILICKSWAGIVEVRLYRELLTRLRCEKEIHRRWNLRCAM